MSFLTQISERVSRSGFNKVGKCCLGHFCIGLFTGWQIFSPGTSAIQNLPVGQLDSAVVEASILFEGYTWLAMYMATLIIFALLVNTLGPFGLIGAPGHPNNSSMQKCFFLHLPFNSGQGNLSASGDIPVLCYYFFNILG